MKLRHHNNPLFVPALLSLLALVTAVPAGAQSCGGDFQSFLDGVRQEALANGRSKAAVEAALSGAQIDNKVLRLDHSQGVFKQTFLEFSKRTVNSYRLKHGAGNMQKYSAIFARAEREYGVPPAVITAFWALETDFGAVQGDFNTINALATLSHDCRRPELFRGQLLAAIEMVEHGDLDPRGTTGAWAGEIGQVQMLPEDIIRYGVDGDGDGHVTLKTSSPDAIMTAARFIQSLGWRQGEPWLQEVIVPANLPWQDTGLGRAKRVGEWTALGVKPRNGAFSDAALPASIIVPQGRNGPVFLAYPNFDIYLKWNQSFTYTTSAAYLATRLAGAPVYDAGNPDPGLSDGAMKLLQKKLQQRGHDVGRIDGILGIGTRSAVRAEQLRLGLPADGWPTEALLSML